LTWPPRAGVSAELMHPDRVAFFVHIGPQDAVHHGGVHTHHRAEGHVHGVEDLDANPVVRVRGLPHIGNDDDVTSPPTQPQFSRGFEALFP
jgi:hypothetical protein